MNDVASLLRDLGLERYARTFAEQAIEWDVLRDLTDRDLAGLGIPLGHRKKLLKAIEKLASGSGVVAPETGAQASAPERRYLTVMFCDLVGSTALARQLDPEDLRPIIRAYQDCCAGIVARLDGFISRYVGDGVLIYFGYPRAHEDDAERALRASFEIIRTVSQLTTGAGAKLQTRIGITTGLVVVGDLIGSGSAQEIAAVGDPLNIAARLQAFAAPDSVVVDKTTRQLTLGLFTFADLGQQALKGISEPVQVWMVTGETGLPSRFEATRGARIPFVNRTNELATLLSRWETARKGHGELVLLAGEPGIGKSRLVRVFENRLAGQPHTRLLLHSSPYHQSTALYPFIEQVKRAAGLSPGDSSARKLEKIADYFAGIIDIDAAVSLFATLLSIPEGKGGDLDVANGQATKERAFSVLLDHFAQLSADAPLLIIVEDAHWLDPTSLEFLEAAAASIRNRRVLLLVTYRPDVDLPLAANEQATILRLDRLKRSDCQRMIEHLAEKKLVPRALLNEIVARADGVALFVEELTKAVLESEIVVDRGDRYELKSLTPALAIPATLNGSLMARLDRHPETREIAQIGSVIGRDFTYDILAAVADLPEPTLRSGLERLVDAELLLRAGAPMQTTYRFKHALVQDAAYESLLLSRRRVLHGRVAEIIEKRFPETVATEPGLLAHHFGRAGAAARAIAYCVRAGRLAIARTAMAEAIAVLRTGLDLLPSLRNEHDARRLELELQVLLGHALRAARAPGAPETGEAWDRARQLCRPKGDASYLRQILYGQFLFHQGNANLKRARELGEELLRISRRQRNRGAYLTGNSAVGRTAFGQGDFEAARRHLERALSVSTSAPHDRRRRIEGPESPVLDLCYLAWTLFVQGHVRESIERCEESIAVAERLARPYDMVVANGNACYMHQFRGDLGAVGASANKVIALAEERGFPAWLSLGQIFRGWVLIQRQGGRAALTLLEQAIADHRATGERLEVPYFLGLLAECYGTLGRTEDGLKALRDAQALARSTGEAWFDAELYRIGGDLRARMSPAAPDATRRYRRALEIARSQGAKMWQLRAALGLARQWHAQSKGAKLRELLLPVLTALDGNGDIAEVAEARKLVG